jgi:hypothetical protein
VGRPRVSASFPMVEGFEMSEAFDKATFSILVGIDCIANNLEIPHFGKKNKEFTVLYFPVKYEKI